MPTPLRRPALRLSLFAAWLPHTASLALLVAVCALVIHWVVIFSAMRLIPVLKYSRIPHGESVGTCALATLFGGGAQVGAREVQLIGVVANLDDMGSAAAILSLDSGPAKAVHVGASLSPQIRLTEIHSRSIVIERNGVRREIMLPIEGTRVVAPPAESAAVPPADADAHSSTPLPPPNHAAPPAVDAIAQHPARAFAPLPGQFSPQGSTGVTFSAKE